MSIEPTNPLSASAAGTHLAQTRAAANTGARRAAASRPSAVALDAAGRAEGISAADGKDLQSHDRDPDGREPWRIRASGDAGERNHQPQPAPPTSGPPGSSSGSQIDLSG